MREGITENSEPTRGDTGEAGFREIVEKVGRGFKFLASKWRQIIITAVLFASLGFVIAHFSRWTYIAETTFVLEEESGTSNMLSQLGGLASLAGIDGGGAGGLFQGDNILQLYMSRSMIEKTLNSQIVIEGNSQRLIDYYADFTGLKEKLSENPRFNEHKVASLSLVEDKRLRDSIFGVVVQKLRKNVLSVGKPDKKLSIIKVEVKSEDEAFAKIFNDQIVKNVNDFYVQTKTKKSLENLAILQKQTDSVRNVLSGAIYTVAAVTDATPNLNPTRQVLRAPAQRSQFNAEANKAILTQLVQNLELAKLALRKETPLIQVVDQPVFPLKREKVGKLASTIIGAFLGAFITVFYLLIRQYFRTLLTNV